MPRKYSTITLVKICDFMESFTHSEIDQLLLIANDLELMPDGTAKKKRCARLIKHLSQLKDPLDLSPQNKLFGSSKKHQEELKYGDKLDQLLDEIVQRKKDTFKSLNNPGGQALRQALRADGYDIVEGKVIEIDKLEQNISDEVSVLESNLQKHRMTDVKRYLDQAHENYINDNFESCNAMLRVSFEAILAHIAKEVSGNGAVVIPVNDNRASPKAVEVRKYLEDVKFFQEDEIKFIEKYYGYASTNGSHPGMSDHSESRLRRLMTVALIQYCLEKFESHSRK